MKNGAAVFCSLLFACGNNGSGPDSDFATDSADARALFFSDIAAGEGAPDCKEEVCDGTDNDCDGEVDEDDPDMGKDCVVVLYHLIPTKGVYRRCGEFLMKGLYILFCEPACSEWEVCGNKIDDDCDMRVDESDCHLHRHY